MSKKHQYTFLVAISVFILLLSFLVMAGTFNPELGDIGGSTEVDTFTPLSTDPVSGEITSPTTSYLRIQGGILCEHARRDPKQMVPWADEAIYADKPGTVGPVKSLNSLPFLFGGSISCEQAYAEASSIGVELGPNECYLPSESPKDVKYAPWPEYVKPEPVEDDGIGLPEIEQGRVCGVDKAEEPCLSMDLTSISPDYLLRRYEGDCGIAYRVVHHKSPGKLLSGTTPELNEDDPRGYYKYVADWTMGSDPLFTVDWDGKAEDCNSFTQGRGEWSDSAPENARCCGDDWIWLNDHCLYSEIKDGVVPTTNCVDPEHKAYDGMFELDDESDSSLEIRAEQDTEYYFAGLGEAETDIGVWGDMFCAQDSDGFSWLTKEEAADKNPLYCEVYLGYNWTGSKCCLPDMTYNDTEEECDSANIASELVQTLGEDISSPDFVEQFESACTSSIEFNRACFEGVSLKNHGIMAPSATPNELSVYNLDGKLNYCNAEARCQYLGDGESATDFVICGYKDNTWFDYHSADYLGYAQSIASNFGIKDLSDLVDTLHNSSLPEDAPMPSGAEKEQRNECCLLDSCWDGESCVNEYSTYMIYNNDWLPYSYTDASADAESSMVYRCIDGSWVHTPFEYNWFHDDTKPGFCESKGSCVCSGPATLGYDYSCGAANVNNDCTNKENFYKEDHLCQALYAGDGSITDAVWTSRTKLLAAQLYDLADASSGSDFTLFCDKYQKSLNYYEPLLTSPISLNSFCVLESEDTGRVIGVSFNAESDEALSEVMFDQSGSFISDIIGEDIESCSDAVAGSEKDRYGGFRRCEGNNRIWFNNKTRTMIYAKSGLSSIGEPSTGNFDSIARQNIDAFARFIDENDINSPSGLSRIEFASDFNRVFLMKKGSKDVFGVVETKHQPSLGLRDIMAVRYSGFDIDCNDVKLIDSNLICDMGSDGDYYIIAKGSSGNFEHWSDLTAKLRLE